MNLPPEQILTHETRLDILCCLVDTGPLGVKQLSAMLASPEQKIRYHLSLLFAHELIKDKKAEDGDLLYSVDLENQEEWVHEAVNNHRRPSPPDP